MYKCLPNAKYVAEFNYSLEALRPNDIELIRQWRNAQLDILRQKTPISKEQQQAYYRDVVIPTFTSERPEIILLSYFHDDVLIGYGGLTNIDWVASKAEVSFLVDPSRVRNPRQYKIDFEHFLKMLLPIAFNDLKLHRLYTETYAFRTDHMFPLEHNGFRLEGRLRDHVIKRGERIDSLLHGMLDWEYKRNAG